jgi:hypothetical protein
VKNSLGALGALLCVALTNCAAPAARFATRDPSEPAAPRRPPGVAVDPVSSLPAPRARGSTSSPLLVLSTPREASAALDAIERFFRGLVAESPEAVDAVLTDQAFLDATSGRQPARGALRSRILQLDYTALRGVPLYGERDVEIYRPEDASELQSSRNLPADMARDQLLVRVHLSVSHAGKNRLFADEMSFFLRPEGEGYRIATIRESTPVP